MNTDKMIELGTSAQLFDSVYVDPVLSTSYPPPSVPGVSIDFLPEKARISELSIKFVPRPVFCGTGTEGSKEL